MNLLEELRTLDWRDPGRWPFPIRAGVVATCFVVLSIAGFYLFVWQSREPELATLEKQELQLRSELRTKHQKAVNLEVYKQQLADIEKSFGAMLRQLPSKTEVDNLLVDISQTGLAAALDEKLFQPQAEIKKDFYAERPIKIRLTGSYHQFGEFIGGIAALPRIVTLHDIQIKSADKSKVFDQLQMDLTAKTYRYLDDEEVAAAEAEKRKSETGSKRRAPASARR
ncbi:MAG: type 4a pilus biogenesis protein PilO [Chloroflexi bacterium]|nr:type 4a pilus biogenesis protein PilO [Chloroflexota bacterium]